MATSAPSSPPLALLTAHTRNLLLSMLSFIVLVLLALISLPPLVDGRDTAIRATLDQTQSLSVGLIDTENSLQQMQASARGYIITQSPAFLEQYRAATAGLPTQLQQLTGITDQSAPVLTSQLADLAAAIVRWERESIDRQVALVEQGRLSDAAADIAVGESQGRFDAIRDRMRTIQTQLQSTEIDLTTQISRARTIQSTISIGLGVLGLVALGVVISAFWRMIGLMQALAAERARAATLTAQVNAQLAAVERQNRQLTVFHAVASASAVSMQPSERTRNVLTTIARSLGLPVGSAWIARYESDVSGGAALSDTLLVQAVAQNNAILIPDTHLPDHAPIGQALGAARSIVILPLRGRVQTFGALVLTADIPHAFDQADLAFYITLATEVGLVLDNAQLYAQAHTERQRLQAIFDHSPEGLVVANAPDGRIILANQTARALIGDLESHANLLEHLLSGRIYLPGGKPIPPEQLPMAATLADGKERRHVELIVAAPDGTRVPVLMTSVPLRDDDQALVGVIAVFQDLRQLREVERLKSDFVALVSHELRTPLTAIKGCTETLLRGGAADEARVREFLEIIDTQGDRLQELIDNLLSLSQVEAGALRLRRTLVTLPPVIQEVLRQQRERAEGVRIQADVPSDLPTVSVDPRRLEQILHNLLDNARRFSPEGGVITLTTIHQEGMICFTVRDQGPGIPIAEHARVFERFYQVAQPGMAYTGGSGLGLTICKALVEAHGGQIGVNDASGGGAELWFTLPAFVQHRADLPQIERRSRQQPGQTHVLVIDDDLALRRVLDRGLADAGYTVQTVLESQAALDVITKQPPDIVLLDLMLPGVDGFELCQQLREWTNVPIIMLTARAAEQDIVRGLQLGADDYLTKPFRLHELVARIEAVLRRTAPEGMPGGISLIQIEHLAVDLAQRRVTVRGTAVRLTPTEYGILAFLALHAGQVLTHDQILKAVWGDSYGVENNYLWVHMAHLRQKIEEDPKQPRYILTERGIGYRLVTALSTP